jgi:hypothetical protein
MPNDVRVPRVGILPPASFMRDAQKKSAKAAAWLIFSTYF